VLKILVLRIKRNSVENKQWVFNTVTFQKHTAIKIWTVQIEEASLEKPFLWNYAFFWNFGSNFSSDPQKAHCDYWKVKAVTQLWLTFPSLTTKTYFSRTLRHRGSKTHHYMGGGVSSSTNSKVLTIEDQISFLFQLFLDQTSWKSENFGFFAKISLFFAKITPFFCKKWLFLADNNPPADKKTFWNPWSRQQPTQASQNRQQSKCEIRVNCLKSSEPTTTNTSPL